MRNEIGGERNATDRSISWLIYRQARSFALTAFSVIAVTLSATSAFAQAAAQLTSQDRKEIQDLVASYAATLGECRAEAYADLFVPDTGYFASGFRGHIFGRQKLIELVESERHCIATDSATSGQRPAGRNVPAVAISATDDGRVIGVADLGSAEYQDEYIRTPGGWRFASRTVIIAAEKTAGLDAAALLAIHRLGGPDLGDLYETLDSGVTRLLTSGVKVEIEDGAVNGRVFLSDGSYRDESYVQTSPGQWRVESSIHVLPGN